MNCSQRLRMVQQMKARGGNARTVAALYLGLTLSSFLHNLAYFNLLRLTGAVSTGVLTALRTIGMSDTYMRM